VPEKSPVNLAEELGLPSRRRITAARFERSDVERDEALRRATEAEERARMLAGLVERSEAARRDAEFNAYRALERCTVLTRSLIALRDAGRVRRWRMMREMRRTRSLRISD